MKAFASPFEPEHGKTVTLAVTDANTQGTMQVAFGVIRVVNSGDSTAFIKTGIGAQTAAVASDMPIVAGATEVFTVRNEHTGIAAICATGETTTLYITPGMGS